MESLEPESLFESEKKLFRSHEQRKSKGMKMMKTLKLSNISDFRPVFQI